MSEENKNVEIINDIVAEQDVVGKRFNWGAFFLTWIWGLGNKVWITLFIIPLWFFFAVLDTLLVATGVMTELAHSMLMIFLNLVS